MCKSWAQDVPMRSITGCHYHTNAPTIDVDELIDEDIDVITHTKETSNMLINLYSNKSVHMAISDVDDIKGTTYYKKISKVNYSLKNRT